MVATILLLLSLVLSQTVVLAVMYVEVITVLVRQQNHFRITRALRPIFFIDNYLMNGVRRYTCTCAHTILFIIKIIMVHAKPLMNSFATCTCMRDFKVHVVENY